MFPSEQLKRFQAFADQIRSGLPITEEQRAYLEDVFDRLGAGEDANEVMGLTYGPGKRRSDEIALQQRFLILHWMRCAMTPEDAKDSAGHEIGGLGLTLEQAVNAVLDIADGEWTNPKTKEKHTYKDPDGSIRSPFRKYSYDTLHALWRSGANKHMKQEYATAFVPNSPYPYEKLEPIVASQNDVPKEPEKRGKNNS